MEKKHQNTFSYALLIYMCIIVLLITLIPFEFRRPREFNITWSTNLTDFVTNIFLFIPIGFLFKLCRKQIKDMFCLNAFLFGILLSSAIEFTQAFIPGRYTQFIDVITNGLGTWLGAGIFLLLNGLLRGERKGKLFSLELPLMNLVYLLVPLMWLNGLAIGEEAERLWLLILLGLSGTVAIGSISIHRFKNTGALFPAKFSLFAMSWFLIATLPVLIRFPIQIGVITLSIGVAALIITAISKEDKSDDRRFELPTLKRILPLFGLYLLLLAIWPTTLPVGVWHLNANFQELPFIEQIVFTFRFIEFIAAFTLLGYMTAEMRGRKDERVETTLGWTFFIAAGSAIIIELLKIYPALSSISVLSMGIIISASIFGAVIYRLQLSAIERLTL